MVSHGTLLTAQGLGITGVDNPTIYVKKHQLLEQSVENNRKQNGRLESKVYLGSSEIKIRSQAKKVGNHWVNKTSYSEQDLNMCRCEC